MYNQRQVDPIIQMLMQAKMQQAQPGANRASGGMMPPSMPMTAPMQQPQQPGGMLNQTNPMSMLPQLLAMKKMQEMSGGQGGGPNATIPTGQPGSTYTPDLMNPAAGGNAGIMPAGMDLGGYSQLADKFDLKKYFPWLELGPNMPIP